MNNAYFERNLGFMSNSEQDRLHDSIVAIAGAGGDGGMLAVHLARMGVGEIRLADPDSFEIENINRQAVCNQDTIGMNKAVAVSGYIKSINTDIKTIFYDEGIKQDNVSEFILGADLVIDETEFTKHALAVMLARSARDQHIPNMTVFNIGFGTVATTYLPDGPKLENRLGFKASQDIEEIKSSAVSIDRWLPYLPAYGDLDVLGKVAKAEKSAPSIAPGVALAASVGATQAFLNLVKGIDNHRPNPVYAPKAIIMDSMSIKSKVVSYNRISYYKHLSRVVLRNLLNMNPKTSF